jgi:hypothetical protein
MTFPSATKRTVITSFGVSFAVRLRLDIVSQVSEQTHRSAARSLSFIRRALL